MRETDFKVRMIRGGGREGAPETAVYSKERVMDKSDVEKNIMW